MCHPQRKRVTRIGYGTCKKCGALFIKRAGRVGAYCGARCRERERKRADKRKRRALAAARQEPFTLREVADRDGWRCHICHKQVPDVTYTGKRTDPTIDHLVPLSAGGDDTLINVALAHMICNSTRNTEGPAQLRLTA